MAKKYEFKPDKRRSGFLSRLYLTQKQRRSLLKWLLYSLVLLVLSVLQDVILCRMSLFGATTDLVPCGIFVICIMEGAGCSVFALVSSMLYLFSGMAPGAYCIVFITAIGIFASFFRQSYLQKGFSATMLCASAAMLLYELAVFALGIFLNATIFSRAGVFCLTWLLSLVAVPLLYPILRPIGTIGGETWKE